MEGAATPPGEVGNIYLESRGPGWEYRGRESDGGRSALPAVADGGNHISHSCSLCPRTGRFSGRFARIMRQDRQQSERQGLV
jgi:hypothetical protein